NTVDSTAAFQIQNNAGTSNLLVADTTNSKIGIDKTPSAVGAALQVAGLVDATTGFSTNGTSGANTTCSGGNTLQNTVVSGGIITGGSCVANGAGATTTLAQAYNNGSSAADQSLALASAKGGGLVLQDASSTVGNLFTIENNAATVNYFQVTNAGIAVTGTVTASGNINTSSGALQTAGTTRIDNGGNLTNIGNL